MSGEVLPQGLTSAPLSYEDPDNGLTIAWKFRLSDPHARGQHRDYALLAVVRPESSRGMEAAPLIWSVFKSIVDYLVGAAEKQRKQGGCPAGGKTPLNLNNNSSFLTGSNVDPDGHPRRNAIVTRASSLAEIVGSEKVFPWLHKQFSFLLMSLAHRFGEVMVEPQL